MADDKGMETKLSLKKKLLFASLMGFVVLIVLIEVTFRIFEFPGFPYKLLTMDFQKEAKVIEHPYMGFTLRPNHVSGRGKFKHNSLGFRGPEIPLKKPEGAYRVACVGGSSTYGHGPSSQKTTWPALLEKKLRKAHPGLNIQVINCGVSGYSTFENMANLSLKILDLEPDLIIIYQSINDVHCGVRKGEYKRDNTHWRAVFHVPRKSALERVLEKSMTYLVIRYIFTDPMTMGDLAGATIVNFDPDEDHMPDKWHPEEIDGFRRNMRVMIAVAREFGVEVILSTQAVFEKHLGFKSERESMKVHGKVIEELARSHKCHFIDNASPKLMPRERDMFTKNVHMTDKGTQRLSDNFARLILENGIIRKRLASRKGKGGD